MGPLVGNTVGTAVGNVVGTMLGVTVGLLISGAEVRNTVGVRDGGVAEGTTVGVTVGAKLGTAVGGTLGRDVGCELGGQPVRGQFVNASVAMVLTTEESQYLHTSAVSPKKAWEPEKEKQECKIQKSGKGLYL